MLGFLVTTVLLNFCYGCLPVRVLGFQSLCFQSLESLIQLRQQFSCHLELLGSILSNIMLNVHHVPGCFHDHLQNSSLYLLVLAIHVQPERAHSCIQLVRPEFLHGQPLLLPGRGCGVHLLSRFCIITDVCQRPQDRHLTVWNASAQIFDVNVASQTGEQSWIAHAFHGMRSFWHKLACLFGWHGGLRCIGWQVCKMSAACSSPTFPEHSFHIWLIWLKLRH